MFKPVAWRICIHVWLFIQPAGKKIAPNLNVLHAQLIVILELRPKWNVDCRARQLTQNSWDVIFNFSLNLVIEKWIEWCEQHEYRVIENHNIK